MRKYFDENGKEVKFGDIISVVKEEYCGVLGTITTSCSVKFKEGMQDDLEAMGWITHEESINEDVEYYLNKVAKKLYSVEYTNTHKHYFVSLTKGHLKLLYRNYPELVNTILVKEVAEVYNKIHKDNLFDYEEVWGVNKYNIKEVINLGKPTEDKVKYLSVFRNCSEAQKAAELVEKIISSFNEGK